MSTLGGISPPASALPPGAVASGLGRHGPGGPAGLLDPWGVAGAAQAGHVSRRVVAVCWKCDTVSARRVAQLTTPPGTPQRPIPTFVAKRHGRAPGYGLSVVAYRSTNRLGLITLNGTVAAPRASKPWREKPNAGGEGRR